ncbi:hypothetical protein [Microbacterium sp. gxy059]|uniref:hypothetical protein n=1 Tax=Microbacterium sp. gxy059 TaxID=2957199 RepID=UPI003D975170
MSHDPPAEPVRLPDAGLFVGAATDPLVRQARRSRAVGIALCALGVLLLAAAFALHVATAPTVAILSGAIALIVVGRLAMGVSQRQTARVDHARFRPILHVLDHALVVGETPVPWTEIAEIVWTDPRRRDPGSGLIRVMRRGARSSAVEASLDGLGRRDQRRARPALARAAETFGFPIR